MISAAAHRAFTLGYEVLCGNRGEGVSAVPGIQWVEVTDDGRVVDREEALGEALRALIEAIDPQQPLRFAAIRYFSIERGEMVIRYEAWTEVRAAGPSA